MASRSSSLWPIVTAVVGAALLVVAIPSQYKNNILPSWLNPGFHLGLDLAGGTQLDFRISESEITDQLASINKQIAELEANGASPESLLQLQNERLIIQEQQDNLVEAIRTVLERRINALGVSEATITPSYVGNEKHLLVECPGVIDVQECIETVGKTIQLEFKEEEDEASEEFESDVRAKAQASLDRITGSGVSLSVIGQDLGDDLGISYVDNGAFFAEDLPAGLENVINLTPSAGVFLREGSVPSPIQDPETGAITEEQVPGLFLVEVLEPKSMTGRTVQEAPVAFGIVADANEDATQNLSEDTVLDAPLSARTIGTIRSMQPGQLRVATEDDGTAKIIFLRGYTPGREEIDVSHILVAYDGANAAADSVTRTKEEALTRANALKTRIENGESFETIATAESDGPSAQNAGALGVVGRGQLATNFEAVAFSQAEGVISDPVETPFGYHLIKLNKAAYTSADKASFDTLTFTGENAEDRANTTLADLQAGKITQDAEIIRLRLLFFSLKPTGWKDTALDGKHFRSASVSLDPTTNVPVVQIVFDEEGGRLFQELTKNNIGKSIAIFVGGELVSAPTVQSEIIGGTAVITGSNDIREAQALAQDLNTGAIPAPIHLTGQRTVEPTLGAEALATSVLAGFIGIIIVMLYMLFFYRMLGVIANLALIAYAIIFIAILKLPLFLVTDQYIVLTLAGAAGMILSIGMAVDTNVLVFERVKEELRKGKQLSSAIEIGFTKAWPSVRDSNISTLITCAILFFIGTSIIRGFAVTLGLGVIISMITGLWLSRHIGRYIARTKIAENASLFPGMKN